MSDQPTAEDLKWWYEYHREDYDATRDRLAAVRNVVLRGRKECAATVLEKACVFAVLSIQTERDRHERAFTAHYAGGLRLEEACGETVYGNQKNEWLYLSLGRVDFSHVVDILRDDGPDAAHAYIVEHFKGLSWTKAAFALAMSGIWELACPDSRTKRMLGIDGRTRSRDDYYQALEKIDGAVEQEVPLFIKQWVLYDFAEQEHARHMAFFREAIGL